MDTQGADRVTPNPGQPDQETDAVAMHWRGPIAAFMQDRTRLIDLEGAFRSGKTTAALWKVWASCQANPRIHWLICRYSDDETQTKIRPLWRDICLETRSGASWDSKEKADVFPNGSRVYIFGLKSQDDKTRYAKLRGLTLAGIYVDQAEELDPDIFYELLGRLSQRGFPQQLILTPNPLDENAWLTREFPVENTIENRRYYSVSVYDNERNLDQETIKGLEDAYPPGDVNHRPKVLGQRGLSVRGEPVYGRTRQSAGAFDRSIHVRPLALDPQLTLYEGLDFGRAHPCVVWCQYTPHGQKVLLGGVLGQNLDLSTFASILLQYRQQWFGNALEVSTCCDPTGVHSNNGIDGAKFLTERGIYPVYKDDSNMPPVKKECIERNTSYMRTRTPLGEAFGVSDERWIRVSDSDPNPIEFPFLADAYEAGYVWREQMTSYANKPYRLPVKDGWYDHGMNCEEYIERNFGGVFKSQSEVSRAADRMSRRSARRAQRDVDPYDQILALRSRGRTGRRVGT